MGEDFEPGELFIKVGDEFVPVKGSVTLEPEQCDGCEPFCDLCGLSTMVFVISGECDFSVIERMSRKLAGRIRHRELSRRNTAVKRYRHGRTQRTRRKER